ncbi:MAG: hypothetical protein K9N23_20025 [Akkermansiaceae bacterium]|nr:hypothetical protein [Akkermansiaceae bacterium]
MRIYLTILLMVLAGGFARAGNEYVVVVSKATMAQPEWAGVVAALEARHPGAERVVWDGQVAEVLPELSKRHPRLLAVVCRPEEADVAFVRSIHRLTRKIDADPYTDCRWGIVTGFDAANALEMARESKPLVIRHTLSGTEIAVDRCESAIWFSELKPGLRVRKGADGKVVEETGEVDSSGEIATALEDGRTGLFITSGHATQRDWQIGFAYRNGQWRSSQGKLMAIDLKGAKRDIHSPHPKVYLAVGNCLMGQIDGPDAMALACMNRAGVRQMVGYTLPTWYGYQGWGMLDYFVGQPGRFTLSEAFFANQHALVHRLETMIPEVAREDSDSPMGRIAKPIVVGAAAKAAGLTAQDANGLLFDRDVVVFYGDPAWKARMAPGRLQWEERWQQDAAGGSLEVLPLAGEGSYAPVNTNGSQRGGRPIIRFFETQIDPATVKVTEGAEFKPVITDDFMLVPLPAGKAPAGPIKVVFTAKLAK